MYTGINYWFYDCSKEELTYVDETVTQKLLSFCSDGHEWDKEQENVEWIPIIHTISPKGGMCNCLRNSIMKKRDFVEEGFYYDIFR